MGEKTNLVATPVAVIIVGHVHYTGSRATVVVVEPVVETWGGSAVRAGGGDDVASNIRAFKIHQTAVLADHKGGFINSGVAAMGGE